MPRGEAVAGGLIRAVPGDVSDEDQVRRIFDDAGPCQVVIANAGIAEAAPFARTTLDQFSRIMAVNLTGSS
ncbi:SDR family NAD(P)-dependent oxidoreductase [Paracoccus marcusii]|uniref:SDR family NAD(P)-dependent oxidoreductase n=1 Tax=Paracoccus marcusii TaxID=59779 RepID=UPI002ED293E9|nr:SDR family NAD(P)-dependent oxidoreductase [Paracoccus marcusii]